MHSGDSGDPLPFHLHEGAQGTGTIVEVDEVVVFESRRESADPRCKGRKLFGIDFEEPTRIDRYSFRTDRKRALAGSWKGPTMAKVGSSGMKTILRCCVQQASEDVGLSPSCGMSCGRMARCSLWKLSRVLWCLPSPCFFGSS